MQLRLHAYALSLLIVAGGLASAQEADLKLVKPGTLTVAMALGNLPYNDLKGGELTGIDGDVINAIAKQLTLTVVAQPMDFPGELAAVQSGRVDVAIGGLSWTVARQAQGAFTDPVFYTPASVIQPPNGHARTIADLENQTIGTVTGYNWIPALRAIPGAKVQAYPTPDQVYAEVSAGRVGYGFVNAIANLYVRRIRPDLNFVSLPLEVSPSEVEKNPALATFLQNQAAFYLPKDHTSLVTAMNGVIRQLYSDGTMTAIFAKYGITESRPYLVPQANTRRQRLGVDRASDWVAPTVGD